MTGLQLYAIPNVLFVELRHPDAFLEFCIFVKSPIEGASWLWNPFKHMIGATKDDAGVHKEDTATRRPEGVSEGGPGPRPGQRYLNGPGKGGRLMAAHFGRQIPDRRTVRIF